MEDIVFAIFKISDQDGGLYNIWTTDSEVIDSEARDIFYPCIPARALASIKRSIKDKFETETRSVVFEEIT